MRRIKRALTCLVAVSLLVGGTGAPATAAPPRVVIGYYLGTRVYEGYFPRHIAAENFTHIDYAFAEPTADSKCVLVDPQSDYLRAFSASESVNGVADTASQKLRGNFNQLRKLKAANPGLKVFISVGGWSLSEHFSDIALTPESRAAFATSCINRFIKGNLPASGSQGGAGAAAGVFDGIDIDWEYPVCCGEPGNGYRPQDRANATLLFQEFRDQLDAYGATTGKRYLLTAALPGGTVANDRYDLSAIAGILSWINLMTYDMHGPWDATTNFHSPFKADPADPSGDPAWNVKGTVDHFIGHGVPAHKLVVGVPFYGYQYIAVQGGEKHNGLYQAFDNTDLDGVSGWKGSTTPTYRQLVDVGKIVTSPSSGTPTGLKGYERHWSAGAGEPWLWHPGTERGAETVSVFIAYDDPVSIGRRVNYVRNKGLRGLMAWEVALDSADHDLSNAMGALRP